MQQRKTKRTLPLAIGLAMLVVAAAVLIPTVAFAGDEAVTAAASHDMAAHDAAGLQPELAQVRGRRLNSTTSTRRSRRGTSSGG